MNRSDKLVKALYGVVDSETEGFGFILMYKEEGRTVPTLLSNYEDNTAIGRQLMLAAIDVLKGSTTESEVPRADVDAQHMEDGAVNG